jgi:hypothetical protein
MGGDGVRCDLLLMEKKLKHEGMRIDRGTWGLESAVTGKG